MRKEKISVNLEVFKVLKESSGFSAEEIAKKIKVDLKKIIDLEEGKTSLTLTQIKNLAKTLQRPIAVFFADVPPRMPFKLPDYRINREKKLTPGVYLAERRAFYLVSKISELSGKKSKVPFFQNFIKPEDLAREFRKYLNIGLIKLKKADDILAAYKRELEEKLAITIIEYPLKADDVRAFSISSDLSIIVLNENDKPQIKLFSLFHEMCHLLKRNSGICSIDLEQKGQDQIESYCDKFSAEFLVPASDFKTEAENIKIIDKDTVSRLSDTYGVSKQVIWLRLLWLGYIGLDRYTQYKSELEEERPDKKGFGRINWGKVFYNRVGNFAMKEISSSYKKGDISYADVIDVLNIKSKYAEKFIA